MQPTRIFWRTVAAVVEDWPMLPTRQILGLPFFTGSLAQAVDAAWQGALVVAPSGPNLANELRDLPAYRLAVQQADVVLTDSAVMVAMHRCVTGAVVPRHSGLAYVRSLLAAAPMSERVFWVMPSFDEAEVIGTWLRAHSWPCGPENCYIAPHYPAGEIRDEVLLARLQAFRPRLVVINLAGGKQEVLGAWLKSVLAPRAGVVCTGAAIAFLAGTQAAIPDWADRAGLGWLFRCMTRPAKFVPRYWRALPLLWLTARHRDTLPPMKKIAAGTLA